MLVNVCNIKGYKLFKLCDFYNLHELLVYIDYISLISLAKSIQNWMVLSRIPFGTYVTLSKSRGSNLYPPSAHPNVASNIYNSP